MLFPPCFSLPPIARPLPILKSGAYWQSSLAATVLIALVALGVGIALRMPGRAVGTLMQSAFRGNLAYIGIPLLAYSFSESAPENGESPIASAVIFMILTMAVYNILAVVVLQAGSHSTKRADWKKLALSIATNPLLVRDCSV